MNITQKKSNFSLKNIIKMLLNKKSNKLNNYQQIKKLKTCDVKI